MKGAFRVAGLWVPVLAYGALVFHLSSLPVAPVAGRLPDFILHPLEYLGLTLLVVRALNGGLGMPIATSTHLGAVLLVVAYAVTDEIHQLHVPRRDASVKDVLSDALGAVLAIGAAEALQRTRGLRVRESCTVILYTRSGCHLCQDAREILQRTARELPLRVREVDVDTDPALASRYGNQVPVIAVDGLSISKLVPDEAAIRRRLLRLAARSS